MSLFTDISSDDDGTINSVVVGCDVDGIRVVYTDLDSAKAWAKAHQCTGTAYPKKRVPDVRKAEFLKRMGTGIHTTEEVSELTGVANASARLGKLHKEGHVRRLTKGRKVVWQALEAGSEAPESKIAVAAAPELIKPSEGRTAIRVEFPWITVNGNRRLMTPKEQELHKAFTEQGFVPRSTTSEEYIAKWDALVAEVEKPKLVRPFYGDAPLLQGFGDNSVVYGRFGFKGHMGHDYGIVMQPVLAAHDGIVEYAGDGGEWPMMGAAAGTCILLKGETLRTGYAHLERSYVRIGDSVKAGSVIGISGDTGATTGFHLHFEVMPIPYTHNNGYAGRTDPTPYMKGAA